MRKQRKRSTVQLQLAPNGESVYIPLSRGHCVLVDLGDYEWLSQWNWCLAECRGTRYAKRGVFDPETGTMRAVMMHRLILDAPAGMEIDHINGDGLDNRRCNLRVVTRQQNLRHRHSWSKHGYKGVHYNKQDGKWQLTLRPEFDTAEDAARAADRVAKMFYGEYAYLNFPEDEDYSI